MISIKNITTGIFSHLANYSTSLPDLYWPNVNKDLPQDEYIKVDILPGNTQSLGVKSLDRTPGIIQLMVNVSEGSGTTRPLEIADQLLGYFPRGTEIEESGTKVRIDKAGYTSPAMQNGTWYSIAVSIPFYVLR